MQIKDISCVDIFDSRGEPTLSVFIKLDSGFFGIAEVPSGKSRGKNEAVVVSYDDAKKNAKRLFMMSHGKSFSSTKQFDNFLIKSDGTENKRNLGGNLMIGLSIAFARATANKEKKELWEIIKNVYFKDDIKSKSHQSRPIIFSNLINGGVHAQTDLSIQEYIAVAHPIGSANNTVSKLISVYREVGLIIQKKTGMKRLTIGDEGGYAIDFENNKVPLEIINQAIKKCGFENIFSLAIDAAASEFYKNGKYNFEGKQISRNDLIEKYHSYVHNIPSLISIEDPLDEDDASGFGEVHSKLPKIWIIGDDLTTTSSKKIDFCMKNNYITGAIIKPNQIGTLLETCEAIKIVKNNGGKTIISHRSGETADTAIIHIAKASSVDAVKIGAPARERLAKFNEYIRLFN